MFARIYTTLFGEDAKKLVVTTPDDSKPVQIPVTQPVRSLAPEPLNACFELGNLFVSTAFSRFMNNNPNLQLTLLIINIGCDYIPAPKMQLSDDVKVFNVAFPDVIGKKNQQNDLSEVDAPSNDLICELDQEDCAQSLLKALPTANPAMIFLRTAKSRIPEEKVMALISTLLNRLEGILTIEFFRNQSDTSKAASTSSVVKSIYTPSGAMNFFASQGAVQTETDIGINLAHLYGKDKDASQKEYFISTYRMAN